MSLFNGDDLQNASASVQSDDMEVEPEVAPRAQRPNFLTAARFVDFELPPEILEGLDNAGFEYATPIQAQAIPVALNGFDIAGQAQTGTGKTTAFLIPLLCRLLKNKPLEPDMPRALIVTPTRELALQIHEDALVLAKATGLKQVLVIGGMDYKEQADILRTAPEIIICTPGRIIDYIKQGVFKTRAIEAAVVDEADRLLDMGFIKDLKYLLGRLPSFDRRQTMLFSATLDERVLELTYQFMNPPQFITAEPENGAKINITQELYHVGRDEKLPLLLGLLRREDHRRVIIFRNMKSGVEWLAKKLTMNGFQAEGITGDLPQPKRLKLMEAFKENRLQILVATDVASRGIHVDDVSHVYNFDLPQDAENYIHRIGRTARAGKTGKAVSFGCDDYVFHLEAIENLMGEKIPVCWAAEEMFHEDQGGDVRMKERYGERDKKGGDRRGGGRSESRPVSRGPAKSQRPGGIFGLSPRFPALALAGDPRRTLDWVGDPRQALDRAGENPEPGPTLVQADLPAPEEAVSSGPLEAAQEKEAQNGRRRKRRRGRRGGQAPGLAAAAPEIEALETAGVAAQAAGQAAQAAEKPADERAADEKKTAGPVETAVVAAQAAGQAAQAAEKPADERSADEKKTAGRKRGGAKRKDSASDAPAAPETRAETPAEPASPEPASPEPASPEPAGPEPAVRKSRATAASGVTVAKPGRPRRAAAGKSRAAGAEPGEEAAPKRAAAKKSLAESAETELKSAAGPPRKAASPSPGPAKKAAGTAAKTAKEKAPPAGVKGKTARVVKETSGRGEAAAKPEKPKRASAAKKTPAGVSAEPPAESAAKSAAKPKKTGRAAKKAAVEE